MEVFRDSPVRSQCLWPFDFGVHKAGLGIQSFSLLLKPKLGIANGFVYLQ